eukprot:scaffold122445_cov63-Phaeocystis_antarctica.AAC.1
MGASSHKHGPRGTPVDHGALVARARQGRRTAERGTAQERSLTLREHDDAVAQRRARGAAARRCDCSGTSALLRCRIRHFEPRSGAHRSFWP